MASYKKIIENMVEAVVTDYIEKKGGSGWARLEDGTMKLEAAEKDFGYPTFQMVARYNDRDYEVHGYVTEFGSVRISSVNFDRDYVKDSNRNDWWAEDNIEHKHEFLYGKELDGFRFDR